MSKVTTTKYVCDGCEKEVKSEKELRTAIVYIQPDSEEILPLSYWRNNSKDYCKECLEYIGYNYKKYKTPSAIDIVKSFGKAFKIIR